MRCITTGFDKEGNSTVLSEENIHSFTPDPTLPSFQVEELFYTEDSPISLDTRHLKIPYDINLPKGAVRFLKVRLPTKKELISDLSKAGKPIPEDWLDYATHRTDSIDFIYLISGKITCVVGEKTIHLEEGDFLVQIGPEHAWINNHDKPCYVLCAMIGTEKKYN